MPTPGAETLGFVACGASQHVGKTVLPDRHVRRLDNGLVVANWARLAFDLAADLAPFDLLSVIDQMINDGHTDLAELASVGRLLCARGRSGSKEFGAVLLQRGGRAAAESHPELRVLDGLLRRGVPVVPQVRHLELPNGDRIRIDMAVEWRRSVGVERNRGLPRRLPTGKASRTQGHWPEWRRMPRKTAAIDVRAPIAPPTARAALLLPVECTIANTPASIATAIFNSTVA